MAALPYMQISVNDYIASTMHLTTSEHGAYMLILMHHWKISEPVPVNRLPTIARMTPGEFAAAWSGGLDGLFIETDAGVVPSEAPYRTPNSARGYSTEFARNKALLLESHDGTCFYCAQASDFFEIDHIVPVARGGSDHYDNLVVACRTCNRSKGAKLITEWRAL